MSERGVPVCLATRHGKERAIGRPMRVIGLDLVVPENLDTDALGTFSGEVPRAGTPLEVCVRKARLGMSVTGLPRGMASEGSFGPHPFVPFIAVGSEVMVFVDDLRGLVIHESMFAERTNYSHTEVRDFAELESWLPKAGFPSHALMVWPKQNCFPVEKGIQSASALKAAIERAAGASDVGLAWVTTDMRAHLNPSRMYSIRKLAFRLARRLATPCPSCEAPEWGRTEVIAGLPCEACHTPTELIKLEVFTCAACEFRRELPRSDSLAFAPPRSCPQCNP